MPSRCRRLLPSRSTWVLLGLTFCYLYFLTYIPGLNNPNENTRLYLTQAIVEKGDTTIGRKTVEKGRVIYENFRGQRFGSAFVNDIGLVCDDPSLQPPDCTGFLYAAKAPGVSYLAVPAYWVMVHVFGLDARPLGDWLVVWLLRIFTITLPCLCFLVFFRRVCVAFSSDDDAADVATIGLGLGTIAFPYGLLFAGHYIQGILLFTSIVCLARIRHRNGGKFAAFCAGICVSLAVLVDYPAGMAAIMISVFVLCAIRPWKLWFAYAGGMLPFGLLFAQYHQAAFGSPFRTAHYFLESAHNRASQAGGFLGIETFRWENLGKSFLSPDAGMFFMSPWLILGVFGIFSLLSNRKWRAEALIMTLVIAGFAIFVSSLGAWRTMLGWTIGPRYLCAIVPFLAFLAFVWLTRQRDCNRPIMRSLGFGLVPVSLLFVTASTITFPQFVPDFQNPIYESAFAMLQQDCFSFNLGAVFGMEPARSILPFAMVLAPLVAFPAFVNSMRQEAVNVQNPHNPILQMLLVLVVSGALLFGLRHAATTPADVLASNLDFVINATKWWWNIL